MTFIVGIDPGTNGAAAIYETEAHELVAVRDLPYWFQTVNKKQRKRLDPVGIYDMFEEFKLYGVGLVVLEAVGGRPKQGASAGFVFGYTVGLIYMACICAQIPIETVPPQKWKKLMSVTGGKKAEDDDIINRAHEMFPTKRALFRDTSKTETGRKRVDRAEAAMLAKFGGDYVWRTLSTAAPNDVELKLAYRNAALEAA